MAHVTAYDNRSEEYFCGEGSNTPINVGFQVYSDSDNDNGIEVDVTFNPRDESFDIDVLDVKGFVLTCKSLIEMIEQHAVCFLSPGDRVRDLVTDFTVNPA